MPDDQPTPTTGIGPANLAHGSFGALDPTIGSVQLPAGYRSRRHGARPIGGTGGMTYYVAVSSYANAADDSRRHVQDERHQPVGSTGADQLGESDRRRSHRLHRQYHGRRIAADLPRQSRAPIERQRRAVHAERRRAVRQHARPTCTRSIRSPARSRRLSRHPTTTATSILGQASPTSQLGYLDIAMRDDGRLYTMTRGFGDNNTATTNGGYLQVDPGDAHPMDIRANALATFDVSSANPINDNGTWSFETPDTDRGIAVDAMAFSDNSNLIRSNVPGTAFVDGRMLFVVGSRTAGSSFSVPVGLNTFTVKPITETDNLLFRLDPNTGAPFSADLITNTTTHPPRNDTITHTAFQPYTTGPGSSRSGRFRHRSRATRSA